MASLALFADVRLVCIAVAVKTRSIIRLTEWNFVLLLVVFCTLPGAKQQFNALRDLLTNDFESAAFADVYFRG